MIFIRGVLSAILAIATVQASPHNKFDVRSPNLRTRVLATHDCTDFGTGAPNGYHSFGEVCIDIDAENIKVTFPDLPSDNSYTEVHLYLDCDKPPTDRQPGHFPYNSACTVSGTSASCTLALADFTCSGGLGCNDDIFIATHAAITGPNGGTGWGQDDDGGIIFDCDRPSPRANCPKYWVSHTDCTCPVVTTFEEVTCTSTITTTIEITTKPPDVTGDPTSCDDPGTTSTVTVDGGTGTCAACASPYFCGCQ